MWKPVDARENPTYDQSRANVSNGPGTLRKTQRGEIGETETPVKFGAAAAVEKAPQNTMKSMRCNHWCHGNKGVEPIKGVKKIKKSRQGAHLNRKTFGYLSKFRSEPRKTVETKTDFGLNQKKRIRYPTTGPCLAEAVSSI